MIHKTLRDLAKRIRSAKGEDALREIENDCDWSNCAVGTKLRELGIDLRSTNYKFTVVKNLVSEDFWKKGSDFNGLLINGHKRDALRFIKELEKAPAGKFLKNR